MTPRSLHQTVRRKSDGHVPELRVRHNVLVQESTIHWEF